MKASDQKALKHEYREIVDIVKQALNEWDPYDLIKGGAPENEFAEEATQVAAKIRKTEKQADLALVISDIFTRKFENNQFSVEACLPVASRIFGDLEARRLLK